MNDPFSLGLAAGCFLVLVAALFLFYASGFLWLQSRVSGCPVSFASLIGLRRRRSRPALLVNCYIMAHKAGLDVSLDELEAYHREGGNVVAGIRRMIETRRAGRPAALGRPDAPGR